MRPFLSAAQTRSTLWWWLTTTWSITASSLSPSDTTRSPSSGWPWVRSLLTLSPPPQCRGPACYWDLRVGGSVMTLLTALPSHTQPGSASPPVREETVSQAVSAMQTLNGFVVAKATQASTAIYKSVTGSESHIPYQPCTPFNQKIKIKQILYNCTLWSFHCWL